MSLQLSRAEFVRNLQESGLFSKEMEAGLDASGRTENADADALARELIAAGKLTPFQAQAVAGRKFEELMIGNYQVLDRLGAGGMGTVYKARHRRMKRIVAIKVLSRSVAGSATFVQRFQREVEAVARLSHPNIVMAYDADEADIGHFLVMEFVNGRDLATEVQERGALPVAEAVDCITQAARALDYAHAQGIIHRDIKPANLMRDLSGAVKVADLGLARFSGGLGATTEIASGLTQAGTIMGTVDFMSPEQAAGAADIDGRADIYSLGCTLCFLVTGQAPYAAPTLMAALLQHREAAIPSLCAARPGVPPDLDQVFKRMVAKAPDDRFASMADVVARLEAITLPPGVEPGPGQSQETVQFLAPTAAAKASPRGPEPHAGKAARRTTAVVPDASPMSAGQTVLLVEPSRAQGVIVRNLLQELGYPDIYTARSGAEALEVVNKAAPAVTISAMHLPDMTGVQLAQKMRASALRASLRFVLITSQQDAERLDLSDATADTIRLPKPFDRDRLARALAAAVGDRSRPAPAPAPEALGRLRVLIVDDSAAARVHIRGVLQSLGLSQFVDAADGARAVAAMAAQNFDLIITDYNMPYMDGRGLLGYLKQNPATASIPVIMVTTETDPSILAAVRALGVAAVCDKSFPTDAVRSIIDELASKP